LEKKFAAQVQPVVKMRVTSLREREMQVRILPREFVPAWLNGKTPNRTFVADSPADSFHPQVGREPVRRHCMSIVIRNGKPQVTESLCNSCYWAHIQRGFAESEEIILCAFLRPARLVPFKVSHCTDYNDKRVPSKSDMEEIAWIIRTKDVNRPVGFSKKAGVEDETEKGRQRKDCALRIACK
jgi:hypothetical protein